MGTLQVKNVYLIPVDKLINLSKIIPPPLGLNCKLILRYMFGHRFDLPLPLLLHILAYSLAFKVRLSRYTCSMILNSHVFWLDFTF